MIYTQRIFWPQYHSSEKLERLLRFLAGHRGLADEISFFTEGDGLDWRYLEPAEVESRAAFLTEAVRRTREAGYVPVINILNTLGHSDEGGADAPRVPWQGMVGWDGKEARQCSCPADARFLDYVRFKYEQFAGCGADRYWIDDDVRLAGHLPVSWGCFCSGCLADFSHRTGRCFDLPGLIVALRSDRSIRTAWISRNEEVFTNLLSACAEGVRQGNSKAGIGLMACDAADFIDTGADFRSWFERLTGGFKQQGWLRAGGGFWSEEHPRSLLWKANVVANTFDHLPPEVRTTYEVENYPYTIGSKGAVATGLECLLMILTTRLDGIMFDVLDLAGNDPAAYQSWMSSLGEWRPLWDRAETLTRGTLPVGWKPAYSKRHFQQHIEERENLPGLLRTECQRVFMLQLAGVPLTGYCEGAVGFLLTGEAAKGMNEEELAALLQKPLIMDGEAARRFISVGLGPRIGINTIDDRSEGVWERFTGHAINGAHAGYKRAATLKYFGLRSYILEPAPGTESLGELLDYRGNVLGSSLTLYRSGTAPVAVLGHMPWQHVLSPQRMTQMRALSAAMLENRLPVTIESDQPVALWLRQDPSGSTIAVLLNTGFDSACVRLVTGYGTSRSLSVSLGTPGVAQTGVSGISLPAWGMALVQFA